METLTTVNGDGIIATSGESSSELSTTPPNNLDILDVVSAEHKDDSGDYKSPEDSPTTFSRVKPEVEYFDIRFNDNGALEYNTNMDVYKALGAIDVVKTQIMKNITSAGDTRSVIDTALENYFMGRK